MKWFGISWGAHICEEAEQVPVPVTEKCFHCEGSFLEHDRGFVLPFSSAEGVRDTFWHYSCLTVTILG